MTDQAREGDPRYGGHERRSTGGSAGQPPPAVPGDQPQGNGMPPGTSAAGDRVGSGPSLDALQARIAELEDQQLRALADVDNMRKRCARDIERARSGERARVASEWLPVLDNLDLALAHADADPAVIIDGVRAVRDQAASVVQRLGFPRRDDVGTVFDPSRHDAIGSRAGTDAKAGTVVEVLRPAYGEGDHQLRPALVVVATDN
ncbi:MAG: nucleotide exchange factor GrpE [Streptosporangiaceae bacterium]